MKKHIKVLSLAALLCAAGSQSFAQAKKGAWVNLFNGKDIKGWHSFNKTGAVKNWEVENGALVCLGSVKGTDTGGDIVSDKQYDNFELAWEWKIDKGSNSGVLYHVVEEPKYEATYDTGPEYQIIDDIGWTPDKLEDWQKTGADYAMHIANGNKKLMPVGQWNTSKIIFDKGHVEHWLNGKKIVEFTAWDADWQKRKADGKWKDHPAYGMASIGHIALQDHGHKAYYRNIKVREL